MIFFIWRKRMNKKMLILFMGMLCATAHAESIPTFNLNTSTLHIPRIEVSLSHTQISHMEVEMKLVAQDPSFDFKVTKVKPLENSSELFPNEDAVRRFLGELLSGGDLGVADEIMADNVVIHTLDSFTPDFGTGPEAMKQIVSWYHGALSNFRVIPDDLIITEDKVISRFTITGKHTGDLPNLQATGIEISVEGIDIYHIEKGKILEVWHTADIFGMMQTLGVVPSVP
jgi:predicted ester cyclase